MRFLPTPRDRLILEAIRTHTRLTGEQIRRLFFRDETGRLASPQAVSARLRRLQALGLVEPVVVDAGRGAGPYAHGLGPSGGALLGSKAPARRGPPGPVWHHLEVAQFRVNFQEEIERRGGALLEWTGEPLLRSLLKGRTGWPVPDAAVHWRLHGREGTFLLEWDRGSESLGVLTSKLRRYVRYWRARGHRELLPGLGLRPRLAIVLTSPDRAARLVRWLTAQRSVLVATVLVAAAESALRDPLGEHWWRSDLEAPGMLVD